MKHIKLFFAVAILCAATFVGYNAYTNATMTEEERLIQANLEALSSGEDESTSSCYDTYGLEESFFGTKLTRFRRCEDCTYVDAYDPIDKSNC